MALGKVIGRVAIKVLPDTTEFREQAADDLRRVKALLNDVEVDVVPVLADAAKRNIKNDLTAWAKSIDLDVLVDLDLNNGDIARAMAELAALTKQRSVKIAPELDGGAVTKVAAGLAALSGARYVAGMFRNLREELMNLDKAVPKIGVVSNAVATLGAMVMGVSGNLFALSASIASIGPAALALPGLFTGIGIGLATTVAALKDFNTMVPQTKGLLSDLQNIISKNFWAGAADPMRELVNKLFPILNTELAKTSTALGDFFGKLSNSVTTGLLPSLPPMFEHLTNSIKIASGFTDNYVGIIEKLGKVGAAYLPRLAKFVGDLSKQFDEWLGKMGTDKLTKFVETGITALKDLGSVIASTSSIFASLAKASTAAGGATLASLAESLRGVAQAAKDPAFQTGLKETLKAAYDMLANIKAIAGPALGELVAAMSQNFQKVAPIIGDTVGTVLEAIASALARPTITQGLTAMFQGFNDMAHSLAPVMDLVADKFAVLGKLIGSLASNIGTVLAAAIESVSPLFIGLVNAMIPIVDMLGPILAKVITALGPVFSILGDALGRVAEAAEPMFKALSKLVDLLLPILVPALKLVATIIGDALVGVIQGVTQVFEGLVKIVDGVINVFKGFGNIIAGLFTLDFSRMWDGLKQVFSGLGQILLGALQAALGAVWAYMNGTVLGFFKGFFAKLAGPLAKPLGKIFKPLSDAAAKVMPIVNKLFDGIKTAISYIFGGAGGSAISRFGETLAYPFQRAYTLITEKFGLITKVIDVAWKVIKAVFEAGGKIIATVVDAAFSIIRTIFTTHTTVWKSVFEAAWAVVKAIFTKAFEAIKLVFTTGFEFIRQIITGAMDGIYFLFKGPWDSIASFLTTVMDTIRVGIKMTWESIRTWLTSLLDNMIVRFQLAWDAIKTATSTVFTSIKAFLTLVWDAIRGSIEAYVNAIKKVVETVWNAIKKVVETVSNAVKSAVETAWNAIKKVVDSVLGSVSSTVTGSFNTIKSTVSNAMSTIKSTMSNAWNSVKSTVSDAWGKVKSAVSTGVSNATSEVKKLPGKAVNALAGVGSLLYNSGMSIIQGFIDGIIEKGKKVAGAVKGVMDKARNLLPFSPAKEGPFSGKGWTLYSGRSIVTAMADGITEKTSTLTRALSDTLGKAQRIASGSAVSDTLVSSIATGINAGTAEVVSAAATLAEAVAAELEKAFDKQMTLAVGADYVSPEIKGAGLDRRLGGLERQVTSAARSANQDTTSNAGSTVQIDSITIPLEDLKQLKDLEEFLDLLRVRIRQG